MKRGSWFLPTVLRTCCRQSTAHGLGMQTTGLHFTCKGRKYGEEFSNVFLYCILPCTFPQFLFSNNQSYFLLRNQWRPSLPSTGIPNLSPARCVDACSYTSILLIKRSNLMQQCADIYLLQSHSTCFGCQHPSSGALKTVTATSGIGTDSWCNEPWV